VTVTTAADKTYDGTNTAAVSACALRRAGGNDDVTCRWRADVASANASEHADGVGDGDASTAAGNYTVTNPVTATVSIERPRPSR
jgi:hypothetical protein